MLVYNKLVRDKIPKIIEQSGKTFTTKILSEEDYIDSINEKMQEELNEYISAETNENAIEELADLLELIHVASVTLGSDIKEVEKVRQEKALKRGSFHDRVFLIGVEEDL